MKIESRRTGQATHARRSAPASKGEATFQIPSTTVAGSSEPLSGLAGPSAIGAVLLAQQDESPEQRQTRYARRADDLLDRLDEIRISLLSGGISIERLKSLQGALTTRRETVEDPGLEQTLQEIDLRVAVELAKYSR